MTELCFVLILAALGVGTLGVGVLGLVMSNRCMDYWQQGWHEGESLHCQTYCGGVHGCAHCRNEQREQLRRQHARRET